MLSLARPASFLAKKNNYLIVMIEFFHIPDRALLAREMLSLGLELNLATFRSVTEPISPLQYQMVLLLFIFLLLYGSSTVDLVLCLLTFQ